MLLSRLLEDGNIVHPNSILRSCVCPDIQEVLQECLCLYGEGGPCLHSEGLNIMVNQPQVMLSIALMYFVSNVKRIDKQYMQVYS
jgi:hypothetical protein